MRRVFLIASGVIIVGVVLFLIFWRSNQSAKVPQAVVENIDTSTANQSDSAKIATLQEAVTMVAQKVVSLPVYSIAGSSNLEFRIKTLENSVANLQKQIDNLKPTTTITTSTGQTISVPQTKSPIYIPLGWTGTTTALDWTSLSTQSIFIDSADYPGMTGVTFEAYLRAYQGTGTAFARLYNQDDAVAVSSSDVSTNSSDYNWVSSVKFNLANGKRTYVLQLKTLTSYEADIQNARLKISF